MTSLLGLSDRPARYSATAKWLHWITALAVILMIPLGLTMKWLVPEGPVQDRMYSFHEATGALVLMVMIVRLARRLVFGAPPPYEALPAFERRGSVAAQHTLYLLLFIVPLLGWAGANAYGDPVSVYGLFNMPTLLGKDQDLSKQIFVWHLTGALLIAAIATLHICGALYHRFVKRDRLLARMWPGG
jgi:cytochrome b561